MNRPKTRNIGKMWMAIYAKTANDVTFKLDSLTTLLSDSIYACFIKKTIFLPEPQFFLNIMLKGGVRFS